MIEIIFASVLIGASIAILGLHFSGRLKPLPAAEKSYHQFSALGVDMSGRGGDELDPAYVKAVATVLKQPEGETPWRTLLP